MAAIIHTLNVLLNRNRGMQLIYKETVTEGSDLLESCICLVSTIFLKVGWNANEVSIRGSIRNEKIITRKTVWTKNGHWAPGGVVVQTEMLQGLKANSTVCTVHNVLVPGAFWLLSLHYLTCHCQSSVLFSSSFPPHYLSLPLHNPLFIHSEIYIVLPFVFPIFFFHSRWVTDWWTFPIKCSLFIYLF